MADERVTGTLGDLAAVPGLPSEPTLRKLIRENPDFPVVSTGKNGVAYEIDVEAAIEWLKAHEEKRREAERQRGEQVRQFALDLLGPDAAAVGVEAGLSPAERKALLEEELVAMKVAQRRGELVRKSSVEAAFAAVFDLLNQQRRGLSARLAKRTDLTRAQQVAIDQLLERDLNELADKFEEMSRNDHSPGDPDTGPDPGV